MEEITIQGGHGLHQIGRKPIGFLQSIKRDWGEFLESIKKGKHGGFSGHVRADE